MIIVLRSIAQNIYTWDHCVKMHCENDSCLCCVQKLIVIFVCGVQLHLVLLALLKSEHDSTRVRTKKFDIAYYSLFFVYLTIECGNGSIF